MRKYRNILLTTAVFGFCGAVNAQEASEEAAETEAEAAAKQAEMEKQRKKQAGLEKRLKDLEQKVEDLSAAKEEDELAKLVEDAEAEAKAPEEEAAPEEREFLWGALALQKLNPEMSFSADFIAAFVLDDYGDPKFYASDEDRSGMFVREVGLQFQHVLDPYSMFKAAINFAPPPYDSFDVEEVYMTWFGIVPSLSLTLGRFRQNFGILNRWHEHDLDQTGYPMAMDQVLGEDGLNQTGLVLKWFMPPVIADANELTLEVANGENEALFAGEFFSVPTALLHLKNYYDATEATYVEFGLTGMWGMNNRRGFVFEDPEEKAVLAEEPWRHTIAAGADLTVHWSPPQQAKYRSFTWRSEGYFVYKQTPETSYLEKEGVELYPVGTYDVDGNRISWGAYSYVDYQVATQWFIGVRGDIALPTIRTQEEFAWDVVPYVTFWQSEFVYLRLEYQHRHDLPHYMPDGALGIKTDDRVMLQVDFAAGPHKHEKY